MRGLALGGFDLFHLGHVRFLAACRGECDHLTIGVNENSEAICSLDERIQVVEACRYVDRTVVVYGDARAVIQQENPDLLFHGDELAVDTIIEELGVTEAWLDSQNVVMTLVPYTDGVSKAILLDRILGSPEAKRGWFR